MFIARLTDQTMQNKAIPELKTYQNLENPQGKSAIFGRFLFLELPYVKCKTPDSCDKRLQKCH